MKPAPPHQLATRAGFLLRRAHQVAVALFTEEVGAVPLTPPQHNVLSMLLAHPRCHQTALGRLVGYDRATIGAVVAGLEARGLVVRASSPTDRRLKTLTITADGRRLLRAAGGVMDRINERVLGLLLPEQRPIFLAMLSKVAAAMPEAAEARSADR